MARDIDKVIERVRAQLPAVVVEKMKVSHLGVDDDGLWFFRLPPEKKEVQIESSTGAAPFLLERDDAVAIHDAGIDQAAAEVIAYFGKREANQPPKPMRDKGPHGSF